jgi:glycine/D-amino acid oxidase-like deaminating enzyme
MLGSHLSVARQTVGYFEFEGPSENFRPGNFPVWGTVGYNDDISHYGIPEFGRPGIKAARHVTRAVDDDPDELPNECANERAMRALEDFLGKHFHPKIVNVSGCENCLYTNTQNEDFILDHHPQQKRVVIGTGFSGHGFKMGPVSGRILAEMALQGTTSLPEFEHARGRFALSARND